MKTEKPILGTKFTHDDGSTAQIVGMTPTHFETDTKRPDGRTVHNRFLIMRYQSFLQSNKRVGWRVVE